MSEAAVQQLKLGKILLVRFRQRSDPLWRKGTIQVNRSKLSISI